MDDFGPDVTFVDRAVALTFDRCAVDASRIALAGFSDGALYALTLGLAKRRPVYACDRVLARFMRPSVFSGSPRGFVSHGIEDQVLPINPCSRRIVPRLKEQGYDVTYREFGRPHTVPDPILQEVWSGFRGEVLAAALEPLSA